MVKAVVGANWGDEGKGKITDMLAKQADIIVRFQGGANAGHTIVNDYGKFALHTLPSGVFYSHTTSVIANFPMIAAYGYHAYNHYENDSSMYIHRPDPKLSTAENFLRMLRPNKQYTQLEAQVLDVALMLHMEHGGGNNSTFTTRVVTSAGGVPFPMAIPCPTKESISRSLTLSPIA